MADYPVKDAAGKTIIPAPGFPAKGYGYPVLNGLGQLILPDDTAGKFFAIPVDFRWKPASFFIYEQEDGSFTITLNVAALRPGGVAKWIAKTGNDVTGNGTEALPYRTLEKARTAGANLYMIKTGHYNSADGFAAGNYTPAAGFSVGFIAVDGPSTVTLSRAYDGLVWTKQADPNGDVYLAVITASGHGATIDTTAPGQAGKFLADGVTLAPARLTSTASIAACQALPGSFYLSGTNLYVHTFNNRMPDANVIVMPNATAQGFMWFTNGVNDTFYYEGINCFGHRFGRTEHGFENNCTFVAYNCSFYYGTELSMAGVRIQGTKYTYCVNCYGGDMPNSDIFSTAMGNQPAQIAAPNALFYNCNGSQNGNNGGANNFNTFTGHYQANTIIIEGAGKNCYGPMYAFVEGSHTIILGVKGDTSLASVGSAAQRSIIQSGGANAVDGTNTPNKIWIKNCEMAGVNYGLATTGGGIIINMGGLIDNTTLGTYPGSVIQ